MLLAVSSRGFTSHRLQSQQMGKWLIFQPHSVSSACQGKFHKNRCYMGLMSRHCVALREAPRTPPETWLGIENSAYFRSETFWQQLLKVNMLVNK